MVEFQRVYRSAVSDGFVALPARICRVSSVSTRGAFSSSVSFCYKKQFKCWLSIVSTHNKLNAVAVWHDNTIVDMLLLFGCSLSKIWLLLLSDITYRPLNVSA